jgi:hypothetical protein
MTGINPARLWRIRNRINKMHVDEYELLLPIAMDEKDKQDAPLHTTN